MLAGMFAPQVASAPPGAYTSLNPSDKATSIGLSGGNLIATNGGDPPGIVRSIHAISGKRYFEVEYTSNGTGSGALSAAGIANDSHALTASLGYANANGWAFWANNVGARHNGATALAVSSSSGDVFGFAVDEPGHKLWIRKNGTWLQGNPATDTLPIWSNLAGTLYAAACPWNTNSVITMRFDPADFLDAAPSGFIPITA